MKKLKTNSRMLSLLLAFCLLAVPVLSGCGASEKTQEPEMGRYVEKELNLPEDILRLLWSGKKPNGDLVYYGQQMSGGVIRYTMSPDGTTESAEALWLSELLESGAFVYNLSENDNGEAYAILSGNDGNMSLAYSGDGVTYETIETPDWVSLGGASMISGGATGDGEASTGSANEGDPGDSPEGGEAPEEESFVTGGAAGTGGAFIGGGEGFLFPMGIIALDDGYIVLYSTNGAYQYSADGELVRMFEGMGSGSLAAAFGGSLALADLERREINLYDLETGKITETLAYKQLYDGTFVGIDADGVFVGDENGIFRQSEGGWERIVDGGLTSLIMPDQMISGLVPGTDGGYYAFLGDYGLTLVEFTYDESIPAEPDTELEIFSLYGGNSVRLAIGEFQRRNPNVRVNLRIGTDDGSGASAEDVIRALNTELIGGRGPDLIILDGLPVESYIEKGVLTDITELASRLVGEQGLLENLMDAYGSEGKVYGIPARFVLPIMMSNSELLKSINSLSDLARAVEGQGTKTPSFLVAPESLWSDDGMIMEYYDVCAESFLKPDGTIDEAALESFYSDMLTIDRHLKEVTPETLNAVQGFITMGGGGGEAVDFGSQKLKDGEALMHIQELTGLLNFLIICGNLGGVSGMEITPVFNGGKYNPQCGIGIAAGSENKELAESFIELLLSGTVQDRYLYDGFPVKNSSLEKMLSEGLENMDEVTDMGFISLCQSLREAVFIDQVLKDAVSGQAKDLLSGTATPAQAAAKVVEDTRLYLAE